MKRSGKIILALALIVVLIAAGLIVVPIIVNRNNDDNFALENPDLVTKVFISNKSNVNTLLERRGAKWYVNGDRPAFEEAINNMLVITKRLTVRGPVSEGLYNTVVTQLANNSNKVEFYANGYKIDFLGIKLFPTEKKVLSFYVGSSTMDNMGTYMIKENASRPYIVYIPGYKGFLAPYYTSSANIWYSHVIFSQRIPQISTITYVNHEEPEESYRIKNIDSRHFDLSAYPDTSKHFAYDTVLFMDLISSFSDIRYEGALDADKYESFNVDSILRTTPSHEITLVDYEGVASYVKTYRIPLTQEQIDNVPIDQEIPPYNLDNLYAWIKIPIMKDENGAPVYNENFVLCQYFSFENILRKLSYLKAEDN